MLIARGAARLTASGVVTKLARPPVGLDFNSWLTVGAVEEAN